MQLSIVVFFSLLVSISAKAQEVFELHTNARALGMGGAFATLVDSEEALWYNPAGIAKNGGIFWTVIDPKVGVSDPVTAMQTFSDLGNATNFSTALDSMYGKPIWAGGSAKSSVILPFFSAAYYYDLDASIIAENPVAPTLTTNYILDKGVALGTGWSIGGILQMGFAFKYINRTGLRKSWGTSTIADIVSGTTTPDVIFNSFSNNIGTGYSLDFGTNITIPTMVQPTISMVWKNIGNTNFRSDLGVTPPPTDNDDLQIGASLLISLPLIHISPAIEFRNILDSDVQLGKKTHMGVELGLPLIDLRAGLYQGYLSYGVGLNLGILQLDAASWGVELGGYPGQFESRRYMVQLSLRLGFDFGFGSSAGSGSKSGSGGGGIFSGRSPSGKRVKVRR